jgi:Protein of unknown function (DUF1344)
MGVFKILVAMLVAVPVTLVAEAMAQTPAPPPAEQRAGEEKRIEGQVRSVDPSGTEITLTDGTKLATPPRTVLRPGVITEGTAVIASYREENGRKILTALAVKEPAASPPAGPRSPDGPSTAPPSGSPKQ